jgi:hypothetical protein
MAAKKSPAKSPPSESATRVAEVQKLLEMRWVRHRYPGARWRIALTATDATVYRDGVVTGSVPLYRAHQILRSGEWVYDD